MILPYHRVIDRTKDEKGKWTRRRRFRRGWNLLLAVLNGLLGLFALLPCLPWCASSSFQPNPRLFFIFLERNDTSDACTLQGDCLDLVKGDDLPNWGGT